MNEKKNLKEISNMKKDQRFSQVCQFEVRQSKNTAPRKCVFSRPLKTKNSLNCRRTLVLLFCAR